MWLEAIEAGILVSQYVYHRWKNNHPGDDVKPAAFKVPQVAEGSVYPLLYGRCRVRQPVLAWLANKGGATLDHNAYLYGASSGQLLYGADMLFVVGIPFDGLTATLYTVWASDLKLNPYINTVGPFGGAVNYVALHDLQGAGDHERTVRRGLIGGAFGGFAQLQGEIELLNGRIDQEIVGPSPTYTSKTQTADRMISFDGIAANTIPNRRSKMCVLFTRMPVEDDDPEDDFDYFTDEYPGGFVIGLAPDAPAFNFEVWSTNNANPIGTVSVVDSGDGAIEANPIDVIWDLLTGKVGKLGLPAASIDRAGTFKTAAIQLATEGHGYSRAIEDRRPAEDHIDDILRQIDAVLYIDPNDLKLKIKLVRGDFNPGLIPFFVPSNCTVSNWALGGWSGVVNRVRIKFTNRAAGYTPDSAVAPNNANAVDQGGTDELEIDMPGVCTKQLADTIAQREASARSRPLAKCRVSTSRAFQHLVPGDPVSLTWPEYGVDSLLFRIAAADYGDLDNGTIHFDLIQDFFYLHRGTVFPGTLPPLLSDA